jgi:hypothetical protein
MGFPDLKPETARCVDHLPHSAHQYEAISPESFFLTSINTPDVSLRNIEPTLLTNSRENRGLPVGLPWPLETLHRRFTPSFCNIVWSASTTPQSLRIPRINSVLCNISAAPSNKIVRGCLDYFSMRG